MKAAAFDYRRAGTILEALALLAAGGEDARPIAGGQTLVAMMAMRLARPSLLVDLNAVSELAGIERRDGAVRIGAMTRQRAIERSELIAADLPLLAAAMPLIGHRQTRNRGTLGGSLANADPSAEIPLVATALQARLELRGPKRARELGADEFLLDAMDTALRPGELLVAATFPVWTGRVGAAVEEINTRGSDFAILAAAAQVELDEDGVCRRGLAGAGAAASAHGRRVGRCRLSAARGAGNPTPVDRSGGGEGTMSGHEITLRVNGEAIRAEVPARLSLVDFLRDRLDATGTHVGCEHGICGACSVLLDGEAVRACLMFAVQADGAEVTTVE